MKYAESVFNMNEHVPYRDKCWKTLEEKSVLCLHMLLCSGGSKRKDEKGCQAKSHSDASLENKEWRSVHEH